MDRSGLFGRIGLGCLLVMGIAGCGSGNDVKDPPASKFRLGAIGWAYGKATEALGRPPANKEEILPYLKEKGDPDELLRSSVDNQEFGINWGIDFNKLKPSARHAMVTAYEKEGQNGKRYVLCFFRDVGLANETEFANMTFPPGAARP
jgi:hypothetical protein